MVSVQASIASDEPNFADLLESAATLQRLVPDAVLVGGTAAALYAKHRISVDHDHVLADLRDRYDEVLDALEREKDWVTNRATAGKIILGEIGGIEAGVRQLIRLRPLEVELHELPSGAMLRVPTQDETLRVKAFLIVKRNQVRDYLDVAAMADHFGLARSAKTLRLIDDYYTDPKKAGVPVATQLTTQLADPHPADLQTIERLSQYKGLVRRWHDWATVKQVCNELAQEMIA